MKTATRVQQVLAECHKLAYLYELDPPHENHDFVVASSIDLTRHPMGPIIAMMDMMAGLADGAKPEKTETCLFPANELGEVLDTLTPLQGSQKATLDQEKVWNDLGYQVVIQGVEEV